MPYLEPAAVLERFSGTLLSEIRPAISDDEELVQAQAGSMASTLRFLATEVEGEEQALAAQRDEFSKALSAAEGALEQADSDAGVNRVLEAIAAAKTTVNDAATEDHTTRETVLLSAVDDVLEVIDDTLEGDAAKQCRTPLYRVLDRRIEAQHAVLGRDENEVNDD